MRKKDQKTKKDNHAKKRRIQKEVLSWYREKGRDLPWRLPRAEFKGRQDPYKVLVSELMLQQTTVATVLQRFSLFMERFPSIAVLADSSLDEVYTLWSGLGYYRRARYLHETARRICEDHGGVFPEDEKTVRSFPGIGAYTGAALLSFAFRKEVVVKDGNIERVMVRFGGCEGATVLEQRREVDRVLNFYHVRGWGSEWYQGLMDIGSKLCRPRSTECGFCPLYEGCRSRERSPPLRVLKGEKKVKEERYVVWLIEDGSGYFLMEKAVEGGLFGGLWIFPLQKAEMCDEKGGRTSVLLSDLGLESRLLEGEVEHRLTHIKMRICVMKLRVGSRSDLLKFFDRLGCGEVGSCDWIHEEGMKTVPAWVFKVLRFATLDGGMGGC